MRTLYYKFGIALWACLLVVGGSHAQQQNPDSTQDSSQDQSPIPAYRSPLASAAENGTNVEPGAADAQQYTPDTNSLAGAQELSVGSNVGQRNFWQPHAGFVITADSDGVTSQGSAWTTWASIYGGLDVHKFTGHSTLSLTYLGGGLVSNDQNTSNGVTQSLSFSERYTVRRETISILDQISYLPAASSGFGVGGGFGGISLPGTSSLGLTAPFAPNQTILTTTGQDLGNSSVLESDTKISARSSVSLVGVYATQIYFDNNLLNSYSYDFQAGYNYQVTRKDTIALSYLFSAFRYTNFNQSINSHVIQASYSRRVTGRLAFQIGAGPEISIFDIPISTNSPAGGAGSTELYWTLNTALHYQLDRTGVSLSYFHGITSGAGVLAGSVSDTVSAGATRPLTRTVGANFNFGYSRNNGVSTALTNSDQRYDYWFGGASLSRPWGRRINLSLSYQFQYQNSNSSFCAGPACGTSYTRHLVAFGLDWRDRPRAF